MQLKILKFQKFHFVNENVTENRINNPTSDKTEQMS